MKHDGRSLIEHYIIMRSTVKWLAVKNCIPEMTVLIVIKEAARLCKKNMGTAVRLTWFESTFSHLLQDHWQVTYSEPCSLPVRWGKLIQDHYED